MNHSVRYDESTFAGVLRPVEQAESLPPWCYTEHSVYVREQERLFRGGWVSVGREDRWRNAGDYVARCGMRMALYALLRTVVATVGCCC